MNPIHKKIQRAPKDRSRLVIWTVPFFWLSITSLLIILGLETYYIISSDENTIYITGFWTCLVGLLLGIEIYRRKNARTRYKLWLKSQNSMIEEDLLITDSFMAYDVKGFASTTLSWNTLASFKEHEKSIEIQSAGVRFYMPKSNFSKSETQSLLKLLKDKSEQLAAPDGNET